MTDAALEPGELEKLQILNGVSIEAVWGLLESCPLRKLVASEILLLKGQGNDTMYLLLDGRLSIHLEHPDDHPVAVLAPGVSVGELSVIDRSPASAHVVAASHARLLAINEEAFWRLVQASHQFAANLLVLFAQRMRATNTTAAAAEQQRQQFEIASTVDALTRLKNRRWLEETLPRIIDRCHFDRQPVTLTILDVDHFKHFNDTYGHQAGDRVLAELGSLIVKKMRPLDQSARYGGEEFVVVFPSTSLDGGMIASDRLRRTVADLEITMADGTQLPRLTASFGVAEARPDEPFAELIARADQALYRAKENGRNRVERAS